MQNNNYRITDYGVAPNCTELQTKEIQAVLDLCKENGGTVIIPKGRFYTAALYMHSNTTLYLETGAELYGSDNCEDYEIFPIPEAELSANPDLKKVNSKYGF